MKPRSSALLRHTACSLALPLSLFAGQAHAQTSTAAPAPGTDKAPAASAPVEEVVVVGKRGQSVANIAGGASVMSGTDLTRMGAQSYADYLGKLPGVVFNAGPSGNSTAVIRGVGTTAGLDQGQGPTGYYINEIPLSEPGYAVSIPDIDTFDVSRVEVLRGPQGTLYGASSLGGAINYVAKEADAGGVDAAVETSLSTTKNTKSIGYTGKAMLNVPLIKDELAARFVVSRREMPGYLDNIGINRKGSNDNKVEDGRVSVVWTPGAHTKLSWLSLWQDSDADDASYRMTRYGELERSTSLPTRFDLNFALHSARLDHDFGFAKLTAIAAQNKKTQTLHFDYTPYYGGYLGTSDPQLFRQLGESDTRNYELRMASPTGGMFEWLIGASYQKTSKRFDEDLSAPGANAVLVPQVGADLVRGDYYYWGYGNIWGNEKAVFGEASANLGAWKLTLGGRWFDTEVTNDDYRYGALFGTPQITPMGRQAEDGFSPKVSLSYKANPDLLLYSVISEGYRFGNPNSIFPLAGFDTPAGWNSDSLRNYEAGVKTALLGRRLKLDASVFYIDWDDLQVRLFRPDGFTYGTNAGKARIRGAEFSGSYRATDNLDLSLNYTFLDAKLAQDLLEASVPLRSGQQLPGASKHQVSSSVSYRWNNAYTPSLTLSGRYLSDAPANLQQPDQRINGFSSFDARYAMWFDNLEVSLFVNNIADKRGVTMSYGNEDLFGQQEFVIRPRTAGVRLHWRL
ncbi:TonB-dependent receptor [Massilia aurea]|uniref:TonB-dependent receptor n=1 Tax=Massilia aurea TaxID=373040 RepID=UPI003462F57E